LYRTFFKDYTEKLWGIPCTKIGVQWGAQRIKGLSVSKAILQAVKSIFIKDKSIDQKKTETSLIEQFYYPKLGPGQLWEMVADTITDKGGGTVRINHKIVGMQHNGTKIINVTVENTQTGQRTQKQADYFFSTMPVKDLIKALGSDVQVEVQEIADGLMYRDFKTVGLLVKKLKIKNNTAIKTVNNIVPDLWIYIQESDVKAGRIQIFNNWSPYMVKDPNHVWMGIEFFCNEGDDFWEMPDQQFAQLAIDELVKINFIDSEDVLDYTVIRMPKAYPAYFGTYDQFDKVKDFTNQFSNLFLVGRNGMHQYNNADHSMLTSMVAVDNIINKIDSKDNIWTINTEGEYHEIK